MMQAELPFADRRPTVVLGAGAILLPELALQSASTLLAGIDAVAAVAPFRQMVTPGGWRMSVAMTNAGSHGWTTNASGYRYTADDPTTAELWPAMPKLFAALASDAAARAGFPDFEPNACLINRYAPASRLSLHQDRDEGDLTQPIVSVSLGLSATFLWGGSKRADPVRRLRLGHGDVVVWGGVDRLRFHGVAPLREGSHPTTGARRYNLTFRYVAA